MRTPVIFVIFNRPDSTGRVFAEIARAKPTKLLVIADGPRAGRAGEAERCHATRAIVDKVDWDCEVITNYSEVNLGCGRRLSSGLQWAFEKVPEAICLEDDTVPHQTFFPFAEEMLGRYRDDERIMHISGNSLQFGRRRGPHSYYFSRYPHIWGYATWRRVLQQYDFEMKRWPSLRDTPWLKDLLGDGTAAEWWRITFDLAHSGDRTLYDSWDMQWVFSQWCQNGLAITPNANLVSNIGFGPDGTHTVSTDSLLADIPMEELSFPLSHPSCLIRDVEADRFAFEVACKPSEPATLRTWLRHNTPHTLRRGARLPVEYLRSILGGSKHGR